MSRYRRRAMAIPTTLGGAIFSGAVALIALLAGSFWTAALFGLCALACLAAAYARANAPPKVR